jgi:hypothetical protein
VRPDPVGGRGNRHADNANTDEPKRARRETINHSDAPMLGDGQPSHRITPIPSAHRCLGFGWSLHHLLARVVS